MSCKHVSTVAALALAATLLSAFPAAARPAAPRAVQAAPAGLVQEGLAWLARLWGGGREHAATARATKGGGPTPDAGTAVLSIRPTPLPAGGGIDPDGFF